jgi:hypothetical protein
MKKLLFLILVSFIFSSCCKKEECKVCKTTITVMVKGADPVVTELTNYACGGEIEKMKKYNYYEVNFDRKGYAEKEVKTICQ